MSSKIDQKNQVKKETNKQSVQKKYPIKPSDDEFKVMTDDDVIAFAEGLGIKFVERFPEKERVIQSIKRFYSNLKFKPRVHFNRISKEELEALRNL